MLVLTRRVGEEIVIGDDIRLTVLAIKRDKIRIGVAAPKFICVDRQEVRERRAASGSASASGVSNRRVTNAFDSGSLPRAVG